VSAALEHLIPLVGVAAACAALALSRATYYRSRKPPRPSKPRPRSHRALSEDQREEVLLVLDSDRFADKAPRQVYAELLDEKVYLCSV
jgi:putative transposase